MSLAYKSRYICHWCGKYHKNGSKAQEKCEEEAEAERLLKAADKQGELD